jgi:hypothetical protein
VSAEPREIPGLGPGERVVGSWPAQLVQSGEKVSGRGWLILTNQRCLFFRRAGLFGGQRLEMAPTFTSRLEDLSTGRPRRFFLRIGYGDKMEIGGIEIGSHEFQLDRESAPMRVLWEISNARAARLRELGMADTSAVCTACGTWSPKLVARCSECGAQY